MGKQSQAIFNLTRCSGTEFIPKILTGDAIPDCFHGQDEADYFTKYLMSNLKQESCPHISLIPCFKGDAQCFPFYKLCLYEIQLVQKVSILETCRNGRHLTNCTHFNCPALFKCSRYYCVPWKYHCDGKHDCPLLDDEKGCQNKQCPHLFRCLIIT